jgi:hypothetical protein
MLLQKRTTLIHKLLERLFLLFQIRVLLRLPRQYDEGVVIHLFHPCELRGSRAHRWWNRYHIACWQIAACPRVCRLRRREGFVQQRLGLDEPLIVGISQQQSCC